MLGTDKNTGKPLDGLDHLRQSINDILTTPLGSRVMRRDYGSRLFELIDSPLTADRIIDFYDAVVEALAKWEPRVRISKCRLVSVGAGKPVFAIAGTYNAREFTQQITI